MKKVISIALVVMLLAATSVAFAGEKYRDGSFIGFIGNARGDIIVDIKIKNDRIVGAEILNPVKPEGTYSYQLGVDAFAKFPSEIIAKQGPAMDLITGATGSVNDYNKATALALAIASDSYTGNVFYGVSRNYAHGHTVARVVVDKEANRIVDVQLVPAQNTGANETREANKPATGYPWPQAVQAYKEIPAKIVAEQKLNVDVIAGATHSCEAYAAAVKHALQQAGMNPDNFIK
ncbi:MAG: FMN-binding protein [Firmicutes bacterium]|nr:FMN-binding protein [Bacillota bacterium]